MIKRAPQFHAINLSDYNCRNVINIINKLIENKVNIPQIIIKLCNINDAESKEIVQLLEKFPKFSKLRKLTLIGSKINDAGAQAIAQLSHLRVLDLAWNNIGVAGAEKIAKLSHLRELNLRGQ